MNYILINKLKFKFTLFHKLFIKYIINVFLTKINSEFNQFKETFYFIPIIFSLKIVF